MMNNLDCKSCVPVCFVPANLPEIDLSHDLSNLSHDLSYKLFLKQFDGKITNVIN